MIIALLILLIVANAIFVAVEFALVASRPGPLEKAAQQGSRGAALALKARQNLRPQLSGAQLGITASSVVLGIVAQPSLGRLFTPIFEALNAPQQFTQDISWLLAMGTAAMVQMLLGEMVPKNLAIAAPERTLQRLMPVHRLFVRAFGPIIWVLDHTAALLVRPFGSPPVDEIEYALGAPELSAIFAASQNEGTLDAFDHGLLSGSLALAQRPSKESMVPVAAMVAISQQATIAEIEQIIVTTGHTRFPVYAQNRQDLVGMVHAKELLAFGPQDQNLALPASAVRPLITATETTTRQEALVIMRKNKTHLVVLENSAGQPQGLVTMEDIVQELMGE